MYHTAVIIDDSPLERFLIETVITNARFAENVVPFNSSMDALAYLKAFGETDRSAPDVIFVDINMPVMTGFDFIDAYLQLPNEITRNYKVVMISSSLAHEDHMRIKEYPVITQFLSKPLSEQMFADLIL